MRWSRLWLFGLALSTATLGAAGDPVSRRVNPSVIAPTVLAIRVNAVPQPHPVISTLKIDRVPAGDYEVTATVVGADGKRRPIARAHTEMMSTNSSLPR